MTDKKSTNLTAWTVTSAGIGINLALGVLYAWGMFRDSILTHWGWSDFQAGAPYALAGLVFAFTMIPAGRLQDKFPPRIVATIGGVLVGAGMMLCAAFGNSFWAVTLGFGVLVGAGIGFGYAVVTPAAIKWFSAARTGLIAGLIVSGSALSSVIIVPVAKTLLADGAETIPAAFFYIGAGILVAVTILAQFLKNPPVGHKPAEPRKKNSAPIHGEEMRWRRMLGTRQFWFLWTMYFFSAGTGVMLIGQAMKLAKDVIPKENFAQLGFVSLILLALGNGAGRILAGHISDSLGRMRTLFLVFLFQAVALGIMIYLLSAASVPALFATITFVGFNYGACLSVFPAVSKDYFGLRNYGLNYGILFTAWGVGGAALTQLAGLFNDRTGSLTGVFITCICGFALAMAITFLTHTPHHAK